MATSTHAAPPRTFESQRNPVVLWHLFSLDAPTVATVWAWFLARVQGIHLATPVLVMMMLAVWILYAGDRLLDARLLNPRLLEARQTAEVPMLAERHYFHHAHRVGFSVGIVAAALTLGSLGPTMFAPARPLFVLEASLLFVWFVLLHAAPKTIALPKELGVGIFFSAAVFIPTVARRPDLRLELLPCALLFAALCALNCVFIYAWEDEAMSVPAHGTTLFAARHLMGCTMAVFGLSAVMAALVGGPERLIPMACGLAAVGLAVADRSRRELSPLMLRAIADLALLTPLLLIPLLP